MKTIRGISRENGFNTKFIPAGPDRMRKQKHCILGLSLNAVLFSLNRIYAIKGSFNSFRVIVSMYIGKRLNDVLFTLICDDTYSKGVRVGCSSPVQGVGKQTVSYN